MLYSFFDGDEVSKDNLLFFLAHGVQADDGAEYLIILNGVDHPASLHLPQLPANARYVAHKNECYDWGTYAWALEQHVQERDFTCAPFARALST